ncbi:hypothetical protein [Streptomyces sp. NPDC058861]|uniref:hypothetical protein n=1 Tax=Streptomyces sp. NPDC058861 TaxID=3346653 RepID=UPI00368E328F
MVVTGRFLETISRWSSPAPTPSPFWLTSSVMMMFMFSATSEWFQSWRSFPSSWLLSSRDRVSR